MRRGYLPLSTQPGLGSSLPPCGFALSPDLRFMLRMSATDPAYGALRISRVNSSRVKDPTPPGNSNAVVPVFLSALELSGALGSWRLRRFRGPPRAFLSSESIRTRMFPLIEERKSRDFERD